MKGNEKVSLSFGLVLLCFSRRNLHKKFSSHIGFKIPSLENLLIELANTIEHGLNSYPILLYLIRRCSSEYDVVVAETIPKWSMQPNLEKQVYIAMCIVKL